MGNTRKKNRHPVDKLTLKDNVVWTFAGNVVYTASQWAIVIILAKFGSPELVGQFALGLAVTAPVIMFTNLQLRSIQATDARREYKFADYLGLRLVTTLAAMFAIGIIAILSPYRLEIVIVILFIGLAKSFESISDIIYGLFQQRERMDRIAKSLLIRGPVTLLAIALVLTNKGGIILAVAIMALVWGIQLAIYDIKNAISIVKASGGENRDIHPKWHWPTLKTLTWTALPLGLTTLLISLNINIPRYFMERYWGENQLGIFAALSYFMVAGNTLVMALGQASSPRLALLYANGKPRAFKKLMTILVAVTLLLTVVGYIFAQIAGEPILIMLYGKEYADHIDAFVLIIVAAGLSYIASLLGYGITATRRFRIQVPMNLMFLLITFVGSIVFIPSYGIKGASIAILILFLLQLPIKAMILFRILNASPK